MPQEIIRTAQIALKKAPLHGDMLALQAQAQYMLGEPEESLRNAYTALALKQDSSSQEADSTEKGSHLAEAIPEYTTGMGDDEIRRLIVDSLEALGAWQTALEERETLMGDLDETSVEDLHNFMYCAMQAERPELVLQASQKAFTRDWRKPPLCWVTIK
jgi:hypothetical protein